MFICEAYKMWQGMGQIDYLKTVNSTYAILLFLRT